MPTTSLVKQSETLATWIKSPEQHSIYLASGKIKIIDFKTPEQNEALNELMKYWREKLGITTNAKHTEPIMNILHIKELYSDLSIEDLKLAIKYSFSGVLDVDFIAYNSFSPLYISKILNAYKQYRDDELNAIARAKMKFDAEQSKQEVEKITPLESRIKYLNYYFATIQESENFVTDFKGIAFDVFSRSGVRFDLSEYEFLATQLVEKDNLKVKNPFEKMIDTEPATIEKYQKWLAMKDILKLETPLQFISKLTEQQLMGE